LRCYPNIFPEGLRKISNDIFSLFFNFLGWGELNPLGTSATISPILLVPDDDDDDDDVDDDDDDDDDDGV
jgi:hypothetical protein